MSNRMICRAVVFSVWCIVVSIGVIFFRSDICDTIKYMTPEEIFTLQPEYFIYFVISSLLLIALTTISANLWSRID